MNTDAERASYLVAVLRREAEQHSILALGASFEHHARVETALSDAANMLESAVRQRDEAVALLEECVTFVATRISVWELDSGGRKHEPARELLTRIGKVLGKEFRV